MRGLHIALYISSIFAIIVCRPQDETENEGKRLIKTSREDPGTWMTEDEIAQLKEQNIGFFDITNFNYRNKTVRPETPLPIPTSLRFVSTVQDLISKIDMAGVEEFVTQFSAYHTRYYQAETGRTSQLWLLEKVQNYIENYAGNANAMEIEHEGFDQRSIIVKLEGADETLKTEVIILGAHIDSTPILQPLEKPAPGADDNASGTGTILETLRIIADAGIIFKRTVEFHWYAAEEEGFLGSQPIVKSYDEQNINVVGMLNLDVVGYHTTDEVGIFTDYTNAGLVEFMKILVGGYLTYTSIEEDCGYGCSDHAVWDQIGYPAVFAAEPVFSNNLHSYLDVIDHVEFAQVNEFIKLAIGFAIEYGEPVE